MDQLTVLLIEDNPGDARLIDVEISEIENHAFRLVTKGLLSEGLSFLATSNVDVILLDLSLPDSHGINTLLKVRKEAPEVPTIVLTGFDDEEFAIKAVQQGAQDYLIKGHVSSHLLSKSMRYAIERQRLQMALESMSLLDEMTGLYNRRGFNSVSNQQIKLAERRGNGLLLFFVDMDGLKEINDHLGHDAGDQAIISAGNILRETFRGTDIVARIGGDEFVILAIDSDYPLSEQIIMNRLNRNLDNYNKHNKQFKISLSVGVTRYDPTESPLNLDTLMTTADAKMYENKRRKKQRMN